MLQWSLVLIYQDRYRYLHPLSCWNVTPQPLIPTMPPYNQFYQVFSTGSSSQPFCCIAMILIGVSINTVYTHQSLPISKLCHVSASPSVAQHVTILFIPWTSSTAVLVVSLLVVHSSGPRVGQSSPLSPHLWCCCHSWHHCHHHHFHSHTPFHALLNLYPKSVLLLHFNPLPPHYFYLHPPGTCPWVH